MTENTRPVYGYKCLLTRKFVSRQYAKEHPEHTRWVVVRHVKHTLSQAPAGSSSKETSHE